jgi:flagellar capping protein FliD
MQSYEVKQMITNETGWKISSLESENRHLKDEISNLKSRVNNLENRLSNQYSAIEQLIQLIIERELLPEDINTLHTIRQYL